MNSMRCLALLFLFAALPLRAEYPAPKEGSWIARDFKFSTGEVFPEVRLHYTTIGAPGGEPVLVLHGTGGSGPAMLNKDFADELFGPGQPLDASRYYIILPDALGTGNPRGPPTACARNSRATTTTTWSRRSTASSPRASA